MGNTQKNKKHGEEKALQLTIPYNPFDITKQQKVTSIFDETIKPSQEIDLTSARLVDWITHYLKEENLVNVFVDLIALISFDGSMFHLFCLSFHRLPCSNQKSIHIILSLDIILHTILKSSTHFITLIVAQIPFNEIKPLKDSDNNGIIHCNAPHLLLVLRYLILSTLIIRSNSFKLLNLKIAFPIIVSYSWN
eukprot:460637_1